MNPFWPEGRDISVQTNREEPIALKWEQTEYRIRDMSARWRIHTGWWAGEEVWRDYWQVATDTGLLCVLFHDLLRGTWHLERIYE